MKLLPCLSLTLAVVLGGCSETSTPSQGLNAIKAIDKFIDEQKIDKSRPDWRNNLVQPPQLTFDPKDKYYWILQTDKGRMKVELLPGTAPIHVSSTIYLTRLGYYDDLKFHRIIPGFMAQGGCPYGNGQGGPGYKYAGEFSPDVRHDTGGLLSMANAGPGTDGSQFFLTFKATPHLNNRHTIFGRLIDGFPCMARIQQTGTKLGTPTETTKIIRSSIETE